MKVFFGTRLRALRGDLSQTEMASKLGTKQTTYSAWERGERELDITTICAICKIFKVTADWLLGLSDVKGSTSEFPVQGLNAAESSSDIYPSGLCEGCLSRDSRIDKLLDILHHASVKEGYQQDHLIKEDTKPVGRILPAGAQAPRR